MAAAFAFELRSCSTPETAARIQAASLIPVGARVRIVARPLVHSAGNPHAGRAGVVRRISDYALFYVLLDATARGAAREAFFSPSQVEAE